ncbi:MAG: Aminodeoxychorismate lyase [Candidatus Roizmanbacteria bacterium GW2011_GWA2_37_7]|uniref:Endolytic murein transglycosylase n=1 Tax=Candidatus Roizmanbacteria bacterium GW2011_GWA2_37_7 TaxID=1618481 RepID=A0A0G0KDJ8_9BACT|nr:MAG: Aminodeoxychorismate lyase [Candidatus Roizmanbacteria bacterium GW2011_GWA2_37_7]
MKKLLILFIIILLIGLGGYLFYREGTLPVNKQSKDSIIFVIDPGQNLDSIINNLSKVNLIRNRIVFFLVVKKLGLEREIQAGDFRLSAAMDAYEIAEELTHGTIDIWVTVPEGLRKEEIAEIMSKTFDVSETEFNQLAQEGYLFPDTYLVPKNPNPKQIIELMKATFDTKYSDELRAQASINGLTDEEVVNLASIVEREAKFDQDRAQVASILLRRYRENYPLEVDATIQYALGYQTQETRWWKRSLSYTDLEIDSPYNTYKKIGLPPTPISNPGIAAIQAVVYADENTPYQFYLSEPSGTTHYAKTFEDHQINIQKYLR